MLKLRYGSFFFPFAPMEGKINQFTTTNIQYYNCHYYYYGTLYPITLQPYTSIHRSCLISFFRRLKLPLAFDLIFQGLAWIPFMKMGRV